MSDLPATRLMRFALVATVATLAAALTAGCGSDRQDVNATANTRTVEVVDWHFPKVEPLGKTVNMKLVVRNNDQRDIEQLAISISGLNQKVNQQGANTRTRPIWIVNDIRHGDQTAYNSLSSTTYDLGRLPARQQTTLSIPLTPLRRGHHTVSYSIGTNLFGNGVAKLADGSLARGSKTIYIDPTPKFDQSVFRRP